MVRKVIWSRAALRELAAIRDFYIAEANSMVAEMVTRRIVVAAIRTFRCRMLTSVSVSMNARDFKMVATVTIDEAQASLKELIRRLLPGDEIRITDNQNTVARLVSEPVMRTPTRRPPPGAGKDMISFIAPDFDAPL